MKQTSATLAQAILKRAFGDMPGLTEVGVYTAGFKPYVVVTLKGQAAGRTSCAQTRTTSRRCASSRSPSFRTTFGKEARAFIHSDDFVLAVYRADGNNGLDRNVRPEPNYFHPCR